MHRYYRWQTISVMPDDLIAFAWSAPMRDLAARMGMSDVGLRKMLKGYGVVTPPQGHWNRVLAGRATDTLPTAPIRRPGETGRIHVDPRLAPFIAEAAPLSSNGPFATKAVPEDLDELRVQELNAIGRVTVPRTLELHHPGLKDLLAKEESRRKKFSENRWYWDEPKYAGPLWQRRLRLLNALFLALAKRGHSGQVWEDEHTVISHARIGDTHVNIKLEIAGKHATIVRAREKIPAPDLLASTPLRLSIQGAASDQIVSLWCDDKDGTLEQKAGQIAAELIVAGEATFRQRLKEDEESAESERIEREAKAERERIEREERRIARLKELNQQRIANLHRSGELLRMAADVRALVTQVREACFESGDVDSATLAEWEVWALTEADRLDPVLSGQFLTHIRAPRLDEAEG